MEEHSKIHECLQNLKTTTTTQDVLEKEWKIISKSLKRTRQIYEDFEDECSSFIIQGRTRKRDRSYTRLIKRDSMISGRSNTSTPRSLNLSRILPTPDKSDISPLGINPSTPVFKRQKLSHTPRGESPSGVEKSPSANERLSLTSSPSYVSPETQVTKMSGKDFLSHLRPTKRADNRARKLKKLKDANPEFTEEELSRLLEKHSDYLASKISKGDLKIHPGELTEIDMKAVNRRFEEILKKSEAVLGRMSESVSPNGPPRKKRKIFDGSA